MMPQLSQEVTDQDDTRDGKLMSKGNLAAERCEVEMNKHSNKPNAKGNYEQESSEGSGQASGKIRVESKLEGSENRKR